MLLCITKSHYIYILWYISKKKKVSQRLVIQSLIKQFSTWLPLPRTPMEQALLSFPPTSPLMFVLYFLFPLILNENEKTPHPSPPHSVIFKRIWCPNNLSPYPCLLSPDASRQYRSFANPSYSSWHRCVRCCRNYLPWWHSIHCSAIWCSFFWSSHQLQAGEETFSNMCTYMFVYIYIYVFLCVCQPQRHTKCSTKLLLNACIRLKSDYMCCNLDELLCTPAS